MKMIRSRFASAVVPVLVLLMSITVLGAKKKTAAEPAKPSYDLPQPPKETLDYNMYQLIRSEAVAHSHIMEYASALVDGIGPRLTGSPNLKKANEWTRTP